MCFSNQRWLLHKPKNTFWQDFLPAILLGGEGWGSGSLEVKTLTGAWEAGGSLWSA